MISPLAALRDKVKRLQEIRQQIGVITVIDLNDSAHLKLIDEAWMHLVPDICESFLTALPPDETPQGELLTWAINERDSWQDKNADRYWQMNRVVEHLSTLRSALQGEGTPSEKDEQPVQRKEQSK